MSQPGRRELMHAVRLVVSLVIIGFLVLFARTINWHQAWTAMRSASLPLLAAAILVNFVSLLLRGVRWWVLLQAIGAPSLALALRATVAGAGLNTVLIANGGDAARVLFVTRATGQPSSAVLATVALDRLLDPIGFVVLLAYGSLAFSLPRSLEVLRTPALVTTGIVAMLLVWVALQARATRPAHVPERRAEPRSWRERVRAWLAGFGIAMRGLVTGPRMAIMLALTFLAWLGQLITFALGAAAAHVAIPLAGSLAALLAVNLSLVIRATPGNVGFFQFAYAVAAVAFGVDRAAAIAVSLLIQTLQLIPTAILGVALAPEFILRKKRRELSPPQDGVTP